MVQQQLQQPPSRTMVVQAPPPKREEERRASSGVLAAGRRSNCGGKWGRGSERIKAGGGPAFLKNPLLEILPLIGDDNNYGKAKVGFLRALLVGTRDPFL